MYQRTSSTMPLRQYFLFVGGALLALLFVVDAVLPSPTDGNAPSERRLPKIRIYSEHQGSQAIVIDTNQPTIVPEVTTQTEAAAAPQTFAPADSHLRKSLAQMVPPRTEVSNPKTTEHRPQLKRKVVRTRIKRPPMAQPRSFGFFDDGW
jgi:hypothetical protein